MSLVTPDLKQEQNGFLSLVDAVGGEGWEDRARGRRRGWQGSVPPAGELFFLS